MLGNSCKATCLCFGEELRVPQHGGICGERVSAWGRVTPFHFHLWSDQCRCMLGKSMEQEQKKGEEYLHSAAVGKQNRFNLVAPVPMGMGTKSSEFRTASLYKCCSSSACACTMLEASRMCLALTRARASFLSIACASKFHQAEHQ